LRPSKLVGVLILSAATVAGAASSATASPSGYTYDQFSMMFGSNAGQYDDVTGYPSGQWAWVPQSGSESDVSWGDPAAWPPSGYERFEHVNDWVVLDGFQNGSIWEPQVVSKELMGDVNCSDEVDVTPADGRELYSKWNVDDTAYCIEAWGRILVPNHPPVDFYHRQVWFPQSGPWCSNPYYANRICLKDYEVWADNNPVNGGTPGGPLLLSQTRDTIFALGIGPAFIIQDYLHDDWQAFDRYFWAF
jgi:hypothetical protein